MSSFLHNLFSRNRTKARKPSEFSIQSSQDCMSKEELAQAKIRKAHRLRRYERLTRHRKIWAILNYAKCLEAINNAANFYDLDKALLDYQTAVERFKDSEFLPSKDNITFRFCDVQFYRGACEYHLTPEDKLIIANWETNTLDYNGILNTVSERFMEYWNDTLHKYIQNSARKKRVEYLITHLEEVKNRKGLSTIPQIADYLNNLKSYLRDYDI